MKPYPAMAHIHSLNGEMREITVLEKRTEQITLLNTAALNSPPFLIGLPVNSMQATNTAL